jgi:RNA polymerase sigma factor for flagellar operon FliA
VGKPSQRRALGALFLLLTAVLAGIAWAAYKADQWVILVAAGVLAAWMATLVLRACARVNRRVRRGAAYSLGVADDTRALWRSYRTSGDAALRDRLILTYAPLVKFVAGRISSGLPSHVDENDLVSYGLLGLIGAIERYDPDRDVKFETYAIARIKGSIIDELRAMDWVPRSVRARARDIERAIAELEAKLGRAPNDEEIAAKLGLTQDELDSSLTEISRSSIAALDELWTVQGSSGDQVALIDTIEDTQGPAPTTALDQSEMKEMIADAISRLPEREKLVITLYYYEELTLREIGEVLGVTESRVSQLHTKAILRLKARLSGTPVRSSLES